MCACVCVCVCLFVCVETDIAPNTQEKYLCAARYKNICAATEIRKNVESTDSFLPVNIFYMEHIIWKSFYRKHKKLCIRCYHSKYIRYWKINLENIFLNTQKNMYALLDFKNLCAAIEIQNGRICDLTSYSKYVILTKSYEK